MAKLVTLFASQAEATAALDALAQAGYEDVETEVIETAAEAAGRHGDVVPVGALPQGVETGMQRQAAFLPALDNMKLGDEERAFFVRGVRGGGVLVLTEVDDDQETAVAHLLREHGGRTYEQA